MGIKQKRPYSGFEQGPWRPPSEAYSLLIRVTRNCPWNRCTFCPGYKEAKFSLRPLEHVLMDIDAIYHATEIIQQQSQQGNFINSKALQLFIDQYAADKYQPYGADAFYAASTWLRNGAESVFLQDANSLIINSGDLVKIIKHLKTRFPTINRITSYARSQTVTKIEDYELLDLANAGLNRVHIGLESGSDRVLESCKKGVSKEQHITAGKKIKAAGIELSEYVMPGLGGQELSTEHALETADALSQINPDFIRLRTLAIHPDTELNQDYQSGNFVKCSEQQIIRELYQFVEHLDGITSSLQSDHSLNLLQEVQGVFPQDKENIINVLQQFLELDPEQQMLYQVGRRIGAFSCFKDLRDSKKRSRVNEICKRNSIDSATVDAKLEELIRSFIR